MDHNGLYIPPPLGTSCTAHSECIVKITSNDIYDLLCVLRHRAKLFNVCKFMADPRQSLLVFVILLDNVGVSCDYSAGALFNYAKMSQAVMTRVT